jgi:hypothetical protein
MSQRDGFSTGFFLGSIIGGLVGGALGVILTSRQMGEDEPPVLRRIKARNQKPERDLLGDHSVESARQSLETKIAELNGAIDEVRSSLNAVHLQGLEVAPPEEGSPNNLEVKEF